MALVAQVVQQVHVEAIGGVGFAVETGDEVEAWEQFWKAALAALAPVAVDQVHRGLQLGWVTVQPIGFVDGGVCGFHAEGQHGTVAQGGHEGLRDRLSLLEVLGDDAGVAVVGVQNAQPFILTKPVKQTGDWLRIWTRIFHLPNTVSEVGVGVRHPAKPDVTDPRVERQPHFGDDVVGRTPYRCALLRLDAKAAPAPVPDAARYTSTS